MIDDDDLTDEHLAAWLYSFLGAFEPQDNPAIADPGSARAFYGAALAMLRRQGGVSYAMVADYMLGTLPARLTKTHRDVAYGERHANVARLAVELQSADLTGEDEDDARCDP
jgi:hypothetical protein